ncbi:hypothetical protein AMS68_005009 [Peltaster fructicola]|uniref:Uncharacterized protein n=1 Tax=Peltaster fructicola TaxID=286661 RepID=A0A6H0XXJ1_9PEZI|nr:hypothetical protein AMS68_005009 [Peltaster fructicola]
MAIRDIAAMRARGNRPANELEDGWNRITTWFRFIDYDQLSIVHFNYAIAASNNLTSKLSVGLIDFSVGHTSLDKSCLHRETVSSTAYAATVTTTNYQTDQVYVYPVIPTAVVTTTAMPVVIIEQVQFTTTVTIPTSAGFTPVLCEATYQQPYPATLTFTSILTTTALSTYIITISSSATYTQTKTSITGAQTFTIPVFDATVTTVTPTYTSTRTNPIATVYEACNDANIVAVRPDGPGYLVNAYTLEPFNPHPKTYVPVYSLDQTDCCAICQRKQTGNRVIKPKKAALIKQDQMKKKHTSGLASLTEKSLASKAGHLELLRGGKKDKKEVSSLTKKMK